jgi:Ca-activated chloride channel family protein
MPLIAALGAPFLWAATAFGFGAATLVTLYLLKSQRRALKVPFLALWQEVLGESHASALFRRLRRVLSLLLQLVLLALLVLALLDLDFSRGQPGTTVFVIDASASMRATDVSGSRFAAAIATLRGELRGLSRRDRVAVVRMAESPTLVMPLAAAAAIDLAKLDALQPSDSPADWVAAVRLAKDIALGGARPRIVLLTDGAGVNEATQKTVGALLDGRVAVEIASFGASDDNVGIVAFAARRYPFSPQNYELLVDLVNEGGRARKLSLQIADANQVVHTEAVELQPHATLHKVLASLSANGSELVARLVDPAGKLDDFPLDDRADAIVVTPPHLRLLLVSPGELFLQGALLLDPTAEVQKITPAQFASADLTQFDAFVFDRFVPDIEIKKPALYIQPRGAHSPFVVKRVVKEPVITDVNADHPTLRYVALRDVNIGESDAYQLDDKTIALASSVRDALIVARVDNGVRQIALGFSPGQSDLPLRLGFPLFIANTLRWFAPLDRAVPTPHAVGQVVRLPAAGTSARIIAPDGTTSIATVIDGEVRFVPDRVGVYTIGDERLAVSLQSRDESNIAPTPLDSWRRGETITRGAPQRRLPAPFILFVLAALLLSFVEWMTFHRRVTV